MKRLILFIVLLFSIGVTFSQVDENLSPEEKARRQKNIDIGNPFARFGYKPKIATLSKGKYLEFHDRDTIVKIGSFSYHTRNLTITGYISLDSLRSEATLHPTLISRWFSPDPLSDEFPSWSPYVFTNDNPIFFTDPTGLAPQTFYENSDTGETVEVKDNIDKTIVVNDADFQKAKSFASEINGNLDVDKGVADAYTGFYDSHNTYDELSVANVTDYLFNRPQINTIAPNDSAGALELIGGPIIKSGSTILKGLKGIVNPKKTVVIGEDMLNRVIPFAEKNGYKYFKPRGKNPANWMRNQKQWIYRQVKNSKTEIINIGPKGAKPVSKYYKAELEAIKKIKRN